MALRCAGRRQWMRHPIRPEIFIWNATGNYYIIKPESLEEQLILKKDLAALISESDSPLKDNWEAGIGKIWSSPTIDRMERSILALLRHGRSGRRMSW